MYKIEVIKRQILLKFLMDVASLQTAFQFCRICKSSIIGHPVLL